MRGDHGEVAQLLANNGAKVFKAKEGRLVELSTSSLSGYAEHSLRFLPCRIMPCRRVTHDATVI